MNYGLILAGGVGLRMRSKGLPKQFLSLYGKPIIIYTLDKFESCDMIDKIVIVCNKDWIEYMNDLVKRHHISKVMSIVLGGADRQESVLNGMSELEHIAMPNDVVVIHDGVRPLVSVSTIVNNITTAKEFGNAMTVKPVTETVVITRNQTAEFLDFKKRDDTYSLTSPQSFKIGELRAILNICDSEDAAIPLLDMSMLYAYYGKPVYVVKEESLNIKITTPADFYYLKAILELEESKNILGL